MQQSEIAKLLMDDTKFICDLHPEINCKLYFLVMWNNKNQDSYAMNAKLM